MYLPAAPPISPALALRALAARPQQSPRPGFFVPYARQGLGWLARALARRGVKRLMAPGYICREALEEVNHGPLRVAFYEPGPGLRPPLADLATGEPAALLVVHYFGVTSSLAETAAWCRGGGHWLIEDCSQAWLSRNSGASLGHESHAALYSFYKYTGSRSGAGLALGPELAEELKNMPFPPPATGGWREMLPGLARWAAQALGLAPGRRPGEAAAPGGARELRSPAAMALKLVAALDRSEVVRRRRANYRRLTQALAGSGCRQAAPALGPSDCPWVLALRVARRDEILAALRRRGIGAQSWPALPAEVAGNPAFPESNQLARETLLLPVHQGLSPRRMDLMATVLRRILDQG